MRLSRWTATATGVAKLAKLRVANLHKQIIIPAARDFATITLPNSLIVLTYSEKSSLSYGEGAYGVREVGNRS